MTFRVVVAAAAAVYYLFRTFFLRVYLRNMLTLFFLFALRFSTNSDTLSFEPSSILQDRLEDMSFRKL